MRFIRPQGLTQQGEQRSMAADHDTQQPALCPQTGY